MVCEAYRLAGLCSCNTAQEGFQVSVLELKTKIILLPLYEEQCIQMVQRVDVRWFLLCENLCTRSTRCTISLSEMPGQDSSARLKAFSSSSRAPTLPPLCLCFSLSSPKTGRTSVDKHWDLGCLLIGSAGFCELCRAVPLCSLLCGLGRMVGGNVQMGPCSPSSASPSLKKIKNQKSW